MKPRSREINIFSMSALDLFASALGAFILITVVLFPFFPNTGDSQERVDEVKADLQAAEQLAAQLQGALDSAQQQLQAQSEEIQSLRQQLAECQATLEDSSELLRQLNQSQQALSEAQRDLQECRRALKKTFVLVLISWSTSDDVDLHVVDPVGREFYYENKRAPGSQAVLEEDNTRGPGNEIWLHPEAEPGNYRIYVKYYSRRNREGVRVRGAVLHQGGKSELPPVRLSREGQKPLVATIVVDEEGNISVR